MCMIVYPTASSNHVSLSLVSFQEGCAIFAEQDEFLVKDEVINPSCLTGSPVVGNGASSLCTFIPVHGNAHAVEYIDNVSKWCHGPAVRQQSRLVRDMSVCSLFKCTHAARTSFSSSSNCGHSGPNNSYSRPIPPRCVKGEYSKSSGSILRLDATWSRISSSNARCSSVKIRPFSSCCAIQAVNRSLTCSR